MFKALFWVFVAVCIGLGYCGAMPASEPYVTISRILSVMYFGFFALLPFLPKWEKTLPVPATIADAVLAKSGKPVPEPEPVKAAPAKAPTKSTRLWK
jgi:ubiquinol-cytochrome c reductase cytochrome b subunit